MLSDAELWGALFASVVNYYLTTFSIWFGHWFSHLKGGPLTRFHFGHHMLYPSSRDMRSREFRYAHGKHDSNFALVPWLVLQAIIQYFIVPLPIFFMWLIQTTCIAIIIGYIHMHFHLLDSWLGRFPWFGRARDSHALHHDLDANYMVADHLWDKVFGTYAQSKMVRVRAARTSFNQDDSGGLKKTETARA